MEKNKKNHTEQKGSARGRSSGWGTSPESGRSPSSSRESKRLNVAISLSKNLDAGAMTVIGRGTVWDLSIYLSIYTYIDR